MAQVKDSIAIGSSPEKVHSYVAMVDKWPLWSAALGSVNRPEGDGAPGTVVYSRHTRWWARTSTSPRTVTENGPRAEGGYVVAVEADR